MKLKTKSRIAALAMMSFALAGSLAGCELIVDFDRTKIDGGPVEAGGGDGTVVDTGVDIGKDGITMMDAPADQMNPMDTGTDTGADSGVDTGIDTGVDTGLDAPDDGD